MTTTTVPTKPLRDEHRELFPNIEALAKAADTIGVAPVEVQREKVHASYVFLTTELIPHATAEDAVLYAEIDRLIGSAEGTRATDTMRRDHTEVAALTDELGRLGGRLHHGELDEQEQREIRRVLYGLAAVVALHFAKEEEVYLPLLDQVLTDEQALAMFDEMAKVAVQAGGPAHTH